MSYSRLISLCLLLSACAEGPPSVRMQTVPPQPLVGDPTAATVVFLKPGVGNANAIFDESGRALGEPSQGTKLVVRVAPGEHTFVKAMYQDSSHGNFALFRKVGEICSSVTGVLQAGKLYFVEAGLFKLFALSPGDARLASWTALPDARMDSSVGPASVAGDREWAGCVEGARREGAKRSDREKGQLAEGVDHWPSR